MQIVDSVYNLAWLVQAVKVVSLKLKYVMSVYKYAKAHNLVRTVMHRSVVAAVILIVVPIVN